MGDTGPQAQPRSWLDAALDEQRAWWELDVETGAFDLQQEAEAPQLLGYAPERFADDRSFLEMVHPTDRQVIVRAMRAHVEGETRNYEARYRVRAADGEYRHVHAVGRATDWDEDGRVIRVAGVLTDVTPRVEHERKLELLRERSQMLMTTRSRAEATQVAVNAADEVIGAPLSSIHLLDESGASLEPSAVVDAVDEIFDGELPVYEADAPPGTRSHVVWDVFEGDEPLFLSNVPEAGGLEEESPAGCVLIHPLGDHGVFIVSSPETDAFDETERTLADLLASSLTTALDRAEREERLRDREERLERLHEATRELIRADDADTVARRVAEAARDVIGFDIAMVRFYDEAAGGLVPIAGTDTVAEMLPERQVYGPDDGSLNWKAYASGEPRVHDDISVVEESVDSDTVVRSLIIVPLGEYGTLAAADTRRAAFDETDLFLARILATSAEAALDAAERATELRSRRDELERQNERLEEFASVVSHDLRNPLSVLKGSLDLAAETGETIHVERAQHSVERMEGLIEDLLALSRAGETVDAGERVALAPLVRRSAESVPGSPTVEVLVPDDHVLVADVGRLGQLLENLLRNAVEHASTGPASQTRQDAVEHGSTSPASQTRQDAVEHGSTSPASQTRQDANEAGLGSTHPDGGAHDAVHVTVGLLPDGEGFYVADDGPGIPERDCGRVFEHGYSTAEGGTGFGLHIVQSIAEAHGWSVTVTESEAGGARFEVRGVESLA